MKMGLPHAATDAATDAAAESFPRQAALLGLKVLGGSLALAVSAKVQVPFWPVPMTMQTLVVLLLGAGLGSRAGTLAVLAYLLEGVAGLPVFAAAAAGPAYMAGPTAGYLAGFLPAAFVAGVLAERGWTRTLGGGFALMLTGHALVFVPGLAWLSAFVGFNWAVSMGLVPFLAGTAVKSALGAVLLRVRPAR